MNAFKGLGLPGQLVVTVVVMAIIVAVGWKAFPNIAQQNSEMEAKQKQLQDLQAEITKGTNLEKRLPELERDIANREAQLTRLKAVMPPVKEDSEIINKFESLAKRSRIEIGKIQPERVREKEFYQEYPLTLDITGNYHDLAKFFERMARLPRIFNVSGVKISQAKQASASITANFTALTFIYKDVPIVVKKKAAAAPAARPQRDDE